MQPYPQLRVLHREHKLAVPILSRTVQLLGQVPRGRVFRLCESILSQVRPGRSAWELSRVCVPDDRTRQAVLQLVTQSPLY